MEVDIEDVDEELDVGEAPPTGDSAPEQAPAPPATLPAAAGVWLGGPSDQVAGSAPVASSRSQGKAPTIQAEQLPPAKMDEELAHHL